MCLKSSKLYKNTFQNKKKSLKKNKNQIYLLLIGNWTQGLPLFTPLLYQVGHIDGDMHKVHKWHEVNFLESDSKTSWSIMTYGLDKIVGCIWRKIMNDLTLLLMLADSLHAWAPIPVFNSFSLKMSLMHLVHVTIDMPFLFYWAFRFLLYLPVFLKEKILTLTYSNSEWMIPWIKYW